MSYCTPEVPDVRQVGAVVQAVATHVVLTFGFFTLYRVVNILELSAHGEDSDKAWP